MGISLEKVQQQAPELVSLTKTAASALRSGGIGDTVARVALVLDHSGSMRTEYRSGRMQALAEKVLALALNLDDDGAIDLFVFDTDAAHLGEITLGDFRGAVARLTHGRHMGTTDYAGAFRTVRDHYFGGTKGVKRLFARRGPSAKPLPVYALFLTDGAPNHRGEAAKAMVEVSSVPIFWKFLSIGTERFEFLERLDTMTGRLVDNANYQPVGDLSRLPDDRLFDLMVEEYADWIAAAREKALID